jgi:hypothetical protein
MLNEKEFCPKVIHVVKIKQNRRTAFLRINDTLRLKEYAAKVNKIFFAPASLLLILRVKNHYFFSEKEAHSDCHDE